MSRKPTTSKGKEKQWERGKRSSEAMGEGKTGGKRSSEAMGEPGEQKLWESYARGTEVSSYRGYNKTMCFYPVPFVSMVTKGGLQDN